VASLVSFNHNLKTQKWCIQRYLCKCKPRN
jgi:hypothetical protein